MGYSSWSCKESDTTEHLSTAQHMEGTILFFFFNHLKPCKNLFSSRNSQRQTLASFELWAVAAGS